MRRSTDITSLSWDQLLRLVTLLSHSAFLLRLVTPPLSLCDSEPTFSKPTQAPYLLHELWDLALGNVKASHHVHLCIASPLPPPPPEDTNHYQGATETVTKDSPD
ncbi:hypothetical protein C8R41DRAFT_920092 [Lentinula lateritia]|uniref:Uncharacterized protein n=1 Tax=Lentinula lateritia TaxID=40482 RepID=A0ABQ8VGS9_9AGAR|nr:hypothetical protein C8R41DRAFT_920092 [Lentinula lateritia]